MRMSWGLIVSALLASVVVAQERTEPAREGRQAAQPAGQSSRADQEIAAVKLAFGRNEVELAKLAAQKAQSDDVKQFAAQMVKEHSAGIARLEKVAGSLANAPRGFGDSRQPPIRPDAGAEVRVQPGAVPAVDVTVNRGGASGPLNWVAIQQQMAEQCLSASKEELSKKTGTEFDKCFMGMAIGGHHQTVVADKVFLQYASPQFRGDLEECLQKSTTHLNEAKQIMEKLAGSPPRGIQN